MRIKSIYLTTIMIGIAFCQFYSCSTSTTNQSIIVTQYADTMCISPSPNEPLPLLEKQPYLAFGRIEPATFPDSLKVEQNLISQIAAYNSALLHGDVLTCRSYIYPDAIKYCKKYYKGLSDDEVIQQLMKDVSGDLQEMITVCENNGIEVSIVNPNLLRKIQFGNDIIIVFNTTTNFCSEYVYTYSKEMSHDIGVSQNGGVNWWFFTENEDTPTILKMHYSQEIVNKVMGYSY